MMTKFGSYGFGVMAVLLLAALLMAAPRPVQAQESVSTTATYAAYQPFEHGFMVWREDTGEILAFATLPYGYAPNIVYRFALSSYETLPDNPVLAQTPAGLVKPIRGFGRVWGNHANVQFELGWGKAAENGYTTIIEVGPYGEKITLPSGQNVTIWPDGSWSVQADPGYPTVTPPPTTTLTTGSNQHFERGMMLYAANSGTIWVLTISGEAHIFRTQDYGSLPDNPVWAAPPDGYARPILGFGKVWGNFPAIRSELGWGIGPERSYQMPISTNANYSQTTIQIITGSWIVVATNGRWQYRWSN